MPESSRFYGIILKMLYSDNASTTSRTFMCTIMAMKRPSALTASYSLVLCP